ncbi:unannotated protein [freshwater metagenome]|uniref:Unannotated protein n=1 Tax=freshwater metagenome TaxID=449393 RepID=A0A6J6ICN5_9ZZZZ|nr:trypsin-like serine protease [Actinomycetota bacterium]MUH53235.1 trypsin-like serine protease [Actinomycetota bacterium]
MTFPLGQSIAASVALLCVSMGVLAAPATALNGPQQIIGGTPADIDDIPWQVGLISARQNAATVFDNQFCGGSIINEGWVITAAHCLYDYKGSKLGVFAGNDDLGVPVGTDVYRAASWKVHPDYSSGPAKDVWFNDIALVRLNSTLDFAEGIEPIALPTAVDPADAPAVGDPIGVSGWGATSSDESDPGYPYLLRKTTLAVISNGSPDNCGDYTASDWNSLYETCIGFAGGGKDTCWGDSGGPYVDQIDADGDGNTEPTLIGVTSWGNGCADASFPGLATRVTSYLDWIVPRSPSFTPTVTGSNTLITWSPLNNQFLSYPVSGYRIEYSLDSGATWTLGGTATAKKRSLNVTGVTSGLWRLAALNAVNASGGPYLWSGDIDVDTARLGAEPSPPQSFALLSQSRRGFDFEWEQPSSVHGSAIWDYRIYQQRGFSAPRLAESGRSQWPAATVKPKFGPGTYWVVAVNNFGESTRSNTVTIP